MHLVKKLEKSEKQIDHLHVNQLQQTSIDAFVHPRGVEMEEWDSSIVFWNFIWYYNNILLVLHLYVLCFDLLNSIFL